jgi:hypothetical protein
MLRCIAHLEATLDDSRDASDDRVVDAKILDAVCRLAIKERGRVGLCKGSGMRVMVIDVWICLDRAYIKDLQAVGGGEEFMDPL